MCSGGREVHDQFPSSLEKTQKWLQRRIDKGLTKKAGKAKKQEVEPIRLKGNGIGAILQMPPPPKEGKQPKPKERAEELEPPRALRWREVTAVFQGGAAGRG